MILITGQPFRFKENGNSLILIVYGYFYLFYFKYCMNISEIATLDSLTET